MRLRRRGLAFTILMLMVAAFLGSHMIAAWADIEDTAVVSATGMEAPAAPSAVWVMGYYVGYHAYLQSPDQLDYSTMTHIMIGAAEPNMDGTFNTSFFLGATEGPAWARDTVQRAHAAGIRAILMLGGAGYVSDFRATSDDAIRTAFVNNLTDIVTSYGFDGIDLDWEPLEFSNPDDRPTVRLLMQALHAAMPTIIYTIPVGWNNMNFDNMADPFYGDISQYFDRVNMMSYQMVWTGDGWESWHSSALYGATATTPSSIDNTTQALIRAGVPRAKIGIGVGFYGVPFEQGHWIESGQFVHYTTGPYITGPHQNTDNAVIRFADNDVSYSNLIRYYYEASAERWDDTAKVPYLSWSTPKWIVGAPPSWANESMKTSFVSYDNERSIAEKGGYVKQEGLGGIVIWTISEGYLEWKANGEKDPLMKAVKAAFIGIPDLTATWGKVRREGNVVFGRLTPQNIGSANAGEFTIAVYLSADSSVDSGDKRVGSYTLKGLAAGEKGATIWLRCRAGTQRYVIAVVDSTNAVIESSEINNTVVALIR